MKPGKRLLSVVLAIVLVLCAGPIVFAASSYSLTASGMDSDGYVSFTLTLLGGEGTTSAALNFTYDPSVMEYDSCAYGADSVQMSNVENNNIMLQDNGILPGTLKFSYFFQNALTAANLIAKRGLTVNIDPNNFELVIFWFRVKDTAAGSVTLGGAGTSATMTEETTSLISLEYDGDKNVVVIANNMIGMKSFAFVITADNGVVIKNVNQSADAATCAAAGNAFTAEFNKENGSFAGSFQQSLWSLDQWWAAADDLGEELPDDFDPYQFNLGTIVVDTSAAVGPATLSVTGNITGVGNGSVDTDVYLGSFDGATDYHVSYNGNGGTGVPEDQLKPEGATLTLSSTRPIKTYKLTYNANGGSVSPASKSVNATFTSWTTAVDGSGSSYNPGDTYSVDADLILYAQWNDPKVGALATPNRSGYAFVGWFTAADGGTQVTSTTTVTINQTLYAHWTKELTITAQPQSAAAEQNKGVNFTVEATGQGTLSYQWQKSTDGGNTWTDISGKTAAILNSTASLANDGVQYRCKVTDANGSATSNAATLRVAQLSITKQPGGQVGQLNKGVNYKVEVTGDNVKYLWQKSTDGGETWKDLSGFTKPLLTATASMANNGVYYRCKLTDKNGVSVFTQKAVLRVAQLTITKQPGGQVGQLNKGVNYKVVVEGENVTFQWQKSTDGGKTFTDLAGYTNNVLNSMASMKNNGVYYRCRLTDKAGVSIYTKSAVLRVAQLNITKQPGGRVVQLDKGVTYEVEVTGENVKFQWQKSTDGGSTWTDLSGKTANSLTATASLANNGAYYRCKLTDKAGVSTYSQKAVLRVAQLNITAQPKSVSAAAGTKATFSVTVTGDNVKYQWQKSADGGSTWTDIAGYINPSFTITLKSTHNGVRYRCVLTDKAGVKFNSNTAAVTVK